MKDCAYCGLPVEVKNEWTHIVRDLPSGGSIVTKAEEMVTTVCLGGHWYGGPVRDVLED